jgi:cell division protein FtsZ
MQAALENTEAIIEVLEGAHMAFITAGMGGGTGTGASQVIANHASSMGILTVAIVTKPFEFEGSHRMLVAETGIKSLMESVDALLVIPNQKLFEIEDANISYKDAYKKVDEILLKAVRGISDIINNAGYQNVDFADVKATMSEKGRTLMGTGEAKGENRAEEAVKKALTSPLLDNVSIEGATGILYNITAASNLSLREIGIVADMIKSHASPDAKIKFGIVDDETIRDVLRVTVIATGFQEREKRPTSRGLHKMNTPPQPQAPVKSSMKEDYQPQNNHPGYYLGKTVNTIKSPPPAPSPPPSAGTNLDGYINEGSIPSMLQNPESVDDLLDVPSFQRPRITGRNDKWK